MSNHIKDQFRFVATITSVTWKPVPEVNRNPLKVYGNTYTIEAKTDSDFLRHGDIYLVGKEMISVVISYVEPPLLGKPGVRELRARTMEGDWINLETVIKGEVDFIFFGSTGGANG